MSSGKQILAWDYERSAWRWVWYDAQQKRQFSNTYLTDCSRCSRQGYVSKNYSGCSICQEERRQARAAARIEIRTLASRAHAAVAIAIGSGDLADLSLVEIQCSDCGAKASVYDHRDYSKPLQVDPVCRSCNTRRGPAIDIAHLVTRRAKKVATSN